MKVLMLHKFHYIEGGAERYVFNLTDLLQKKGDTVIPFAMLHPKNLPSPYSSCFVSYFNPDQLRECKNPVKILAKAARVVYNKEAQKKIAVLIEKTKPDIAHVHSLYHHISPSVLWTLKKYNIPVIQTLHDFKLLCPNIVFLDGQNRVCELCRNGNFWHAFVKKCFRNSYPASLLVSFEAAFHRSLRTYHQCVDLFHAPSAFLAQRIGQCGFQEKPIRVLPYTLDCSSYRPHYTASNYFVYAGRLSIEKGVVFLIDAMRCIKDIELLLIGTGPLEAEIKDRIRNEKLHHVHLPGYKTGAELRQLMSRALFTVSPSLCHDNSPLAIYEAHALGKPVIGSRMGGIPELIEDGVDGYIFEPGSVPDFMDKVARLVKNPQKAIAMGKRGREKVLRLYNPEEHYNKIMSLYRETISCHYESSHPGLSQK